MASRANDLAARLGFLGEAAELSRGRSDDEPVDAASALVRRAGRRMAISGDHTVIALAGATGSGKSTTFNALSGTQLATSGVTRPTTSDAMAAVWGAELPTELLDWLEVSRRHLIAASGGPFTNLVLLDLPDHDSTEVAHRATVDRLVQLVDMLVWVVDPQKYADAALHDRYLKPLADHADVMMIVLNQADRLTSEQLQGAMTDLRRLLDSEGLRATPVLAMSAMTGQGVAGVRQTLEKVVAEKTASAKRISADVTTAASGLEETLGSQKVPQISAREQRQLNEATAVAAGVPVVVDGVRDAERYRGVLATGWPVLKWITRFKPDPLKRLRLGTGGGRPELEEGSPARTSLPKASGVQKARLDAALRGVTDAATGGLPRGWAEAVRVAARGNERVLADRLDASIASADLRMDRGHAWWGIVNVLQWLLFAAAVAGLLWLLLPVVLGFFQFPQPPTVYWWGIPAPTLLFGGGVVGGVAVALLSRVFVEVGARAKAGQARRLLTDRIAEVTVSDVVGPVQGELDRLKKARELVARAK